MTTRSSSLLRPRPATFKVCSHPHLQSRHREGPQTRRRVRASSLPPVSRHHHPTVPIRLSPRLLILHRRSLSRRRRLAALLMLVALAFTSCGRGKDAAVKVPKERFPDDIGVVTDITNERVQLDGKRRYPINSLVKSFSTYSTDIVVPLVHRKGQYVHLGLNEDKEVIWISGIGLVVEGDPSVVNYTGYLVRVDKRRRAVFYDGTVLKVAKGVEVPAKSTRIACKIDPESNEVTSMRDLSSPDQTEEEPQPSPSAAVPTSTSS